MNMHTQPVFEPGKKIHKPYSIYGLLLALFGVPLLIAAFNYFAPEGQLTNSFVVIKELSIFLLTGILLLLLLYGEKETLSSIGLHNRHWGKSILLAIFGLILCIAVAAVILFIFSKTGISFGNGPEAKRYEQVPLWAITLMVLRAGVVEEICYRGYAMDRLYRLNKHPLFFLWLPLVLFALWHYRQGLGDVIISFVIGLVLAILFWKKRDLKANIVTHFLGDFIPNVLLPLFMQAG
jgi:membrane protease YdiL (CAAX protease family)